MIYQFYSQSNQTDAYIEKYSKHQIPYCIAKKMRRLYPNKEFVIIGEIGNLSDHFDCQDVFITESGTHIPVFPRGNLRKPFEWIAGYIAVGENTYIAAVKSIIPSFCYRQKRNGALK